MNVHQALIELDISKRQAASLDGELQLVAASRDTWQVQLGQWDWPCNIKASEQNSGTHVASSARALAVTVALSALMQATAKQHELKLVELSTSTLGQQTDLGRSRAEAQASAAHSQASQLKTKRVESELQVRSAGHVNAICIIYMPHTNPAGI